MHQHAFLARRRVVDEPGFLEFEPGFWVEVVEFVWARHILLYRVVGAKHASPLRKKHYGLGVLVGGM